MMKKTVSLGGVLYLVLVTGCAANDEASSVGESPTGTFLDANDGFGEVGYTALDEACDKTDDADYMKRFVTPMFRDVAMVDDVAYVVDGSLLWGISLLDPTRPERVSLTRLSGTPIALSVGPAGRLLVANGEARLLIVDVSEPTAPAVATEVTGLSGKSLDVAVEGDIAYVALGDGGLAAVDLSAPDTPVLRDVHPLAGFANAVDVENGIAYVAACSNLGVVDVSDPGAVETLDTVWLPEGYAREIDVADREAYVAAGEALFRYDVTDPANVRWIGYYVDRYAEGFYINAVAVRDKVAYIAAGDESFRAIDAALMSDPASYIPAEDDATTVSLDESIQIEPPPATIQIERSDPIGIGLHGDLLLVLGNFRWVGERLLRVLDVSTPGVMIALGDYEQPNEVLGMDSVDDRVVVHGNGGQENVLDADGDVVDSILLPENVIRAERVGSWTGFLLDDGDVYIARDGSSDLPLRSAYSVFDITAGPDFLYMANYGENELLSYQPGASRINDTTEGDTDLESTLVGFSRLIEINGYLYAYDWAMGALHAFDTDGDGQLQHRNTIDVPLCEAYDIADFYSGQKDDRSRLGELAGDMVMLCPYDDYGKSSVLFYSLADPEQPDPVDRWVLPNGRYRDMIIGDNAIYTLGFDNNRYASTLRKVTEGSVETVAFDGHANRILLVGDEVWVADGDFGLRRFVVTGLGFEELGTSVAEGGLI